ncbi:MAG: hypothetical protein KFF72_03485 [Arthrospira sp. SH-MAG29]|nr:hypothetical protein [Arthrospira sp. SH-MAG29]MBS0015423.1 hypothetical protein [Arthrospira sp. SH-MAG29]
MPKSGENSSSFTLNRGLIIALLEVALLNVRSRRRVKRSRLPKVPLRCDRSPSPP